MSGNKHPKAEVGKNTPRDDLEVNPGIKESKGSYATGEDPKEIRGENTFVGDVKNDPNSQGGLNPDRLGRQNK
jgi:hypothetical protein